MYNFLFKSITGDESPAKKTPSISSNPMAFHVACPITCRRICYCELGFPAELRSAEARAKFEGEISLLEEFVRDPWCLRAGGPGATVQVAVPRVASLPAPPSVAADDRGGGDGEEAASAQAKRVVMQQQAVAASIAAEDYVRRLEAGGPAELQGEETREDQGSSIAKVMCRICFSGETEGSDKAGKMLSCKICNKKYHRNCLKSWAEYRDLFHWSSWACPSCRVCEVCRRAGDPNKLMYCKRCDAAYHSYCQQPPHKNVSHGPYLCPKHTRCHSCGSTVPGSGLSTRWFLGYTCCDACGRLFVKGNYCPVCLKVYRDSETTPMVCCDVCERWVHCVCDGISDEKYQQFQADQNLHYKCAACRGDCYQVRDIDDAVRELWKRRDEADSDLIANLRMAAGLPSQGETFSLSPYSDDEQKGPVILKNDSGRSLKFSVKGLGDKSTKNAKDTNPLSLNKKPVKKKAYQIKFVHKSEGSYQNFEKQHEARSLESSFGDQNIGALESYKADGRETISSSMTISPYNDEMKSSVNQPGSKNQNLVKEVVATKADRVSKVQKGNKLHGLHIKECAGKNESKSETVKGTKLVIHIGGKNRNASSSPISETSSCHREQDIAASYGGEDVSQPKVEYRENVLEAHGGITLFDDGKGAKFDEKNQSRSSKHGNREKNVVKLGKVSEIHRKSNGNIAEESEITTTRGSPLVSGKRSADVGPAAGSAAEDTVRNQEPLPNKQPMGTPGNSHSDGHNNSQSKGTLNTSGDLRPLLKLKFKNPYFEQRSSWAPRGEEENSVKGQRSKRKRPSMEKVGSQENMNYAQVHQENPIDEAMDAKILQKLGKDAVGKRVEVHQSSDNSWQQGVVSSTIEGTSSLIVRLDDGRTTTLELGKQGVRFVAQKQKRTRT